MQDVSGIDLNCGCPKPFSTHAGMGAALLTNPDLLCSILAALRKEMPPYITVTAKIRLLPSQEDTLNLVGRIVDTGVSAITVHCRTRSMRDKDKAIIERLKGIVDFVNAKGKGIAVIENGDCLGWQDATRVRSVTGAHSVMIARAAESNPSCFSPEPLKDVERTLWPAYLRLVRYSYSFYIKPKDKLRLNTLITIGVLRNSVLHNSKAHEWKSRKPSRMIFVRKSPGRKATQTCRTSLVTRRAKKNSKPLSTQSRSALPENIECLSASSNLL